MKSEFERVMQIAEKNFGFMRTNEYIQARMFAPDLSILDIETGPNCNLRCFHCHDECSPERKGLPDAGLVDAALIGASRVGIRRVCLTSGEPLREENREVVAVAGRQSDIIPVNIITNGTFAKDYLSAKNWFKFLRANGFDFSGGFNNFSVSFGEMYPTSPELFGNILRASKEVFPEADIGRYLGVQYLVSNPAKDFERINKLIAQIYRVLGHRRSEHIGFVDNEMVVSVYPETGSPLKIESDGIYPFGKADKLQRFDKNYPVRDLKPEDLAFTIESPQSVELLFNGAVAFPHCGIISRNTNYGNVKNTTFPDILERVRTDVFYQAYKLGGVPLLYHAARQVNPRFSVRGRVKEHVLRGILDDSSLVRGIREYFKKENIVDVYREYLDTLDLRKQPRLV